jgi:hypothetical protein
MKGAPRSRKRAEQDARRRYGARGSRRRVRSAAVALLSLLGLVLAPRSGRSQQLEPRAYAPAPVGLNVVGLAALYSGGKVLTDPSLPIENASARVYCLAPVYARTFDLFGRLASVTLTVPFAWASAHGDVQEVHRTADRSGLVDPYARLAVNLIGVPALAPQAFREHESQTVLGASLTVAAPLGQYDASKLVNLGTHRWAFKPELGLSQPLGRWLVELYTAAWFFTTNDDFYGGHVRKQDVLAAFQTHLVYNFRPRLWAAGDFTFYEGGSTTVDEQPKNDRQANARVGVTLSLPLSANQDLRLTGARGAWARIGSNFTTFGLAWDFFWF